MGGGQVMGEGCVSRTGEGSKSQGWRRVEGGFGVGAD